MALAVTKQAQTVCNRLARIAMELQAMSAEADALAQRWRDSGNSVNGTVLDGQGSAVMDWVGDLRTLANARIADVLISKRVPSHRGTAF